MPFSPFAALCRQLGTTGTKSRAARRQQRLQLGDDAAAGELEPSAGSSGSGAAAAACAGKPAVHRVDSIEEARMRITLRRCSLENSGHLHPRAELEHAELHVALPREDSLTLARRRLSTEVATTGGASSRAPASSAGSLLNAATTATAAASDASCSGALTASAWEALADACAARHLVRFSSDVSDALSPAPGQQQLEQQLA